jgi:peptidoglycan hydrolase-like protein with peptidoglycan-binding domain
MAVLKRGMSGDEVTALQTRLAQLGFDPGPADGVFGEGTEAAVRAFQASRGLSADGVVGDGTAAALAPDGQAAAAELAIDGVTVEMVAQMFPGTPLVNIQTHLPPVLGALVAASLADKPMVLMALATIRAETGSFRPISEGVSRFNSSGAAGGHPFDLYDNRTDLGNRGEPDGERFKGRGFVQLTGRVNYQQHGRAIGMGDQLVENPDLANDPAIAAKLLASFLKSKEAKIRGALSTDDLATARKLVNGGSHGLDTFTAAFEMGDGLIEG